jgi:hypothetical protein
MKHKHAELIKAWADGAIIQYKDIKGLWIDMDWIMPNWDSCECEFRIKPEPKPDVVKSFYANLNYHFQGMHISARLDEVHNLKLTFDGETGKLKSAEVLK